MTAGMRAGLGFAFVLGCLAGCESTQSASGPNQNPVGRKPDLDSSTLPEARGPEVLPDTHVAAGRLHESQGHLARAVEQYRNAIALDPRQLEAHNRLGIVLDRLGSFREADECFRKAIQIAPDKPYLRNNLGFSYMMQSRWKEAEAEFLKSIELSPGFVRARVNLGMVLAQQERFDDAMAAFQQALPIEDAYYNMGLMYQARRRSVEAARAFKSALDHNPKMTAARKRLEAMPPEVLKAADDAPETALASASPAPTTMPAALPAENANAATRPASQAPLLSPLGPRIEPPPAGAQIDQGETGDWEPLDYLLRELNPFEAFFESGPPDDGPAICDASDLIAARDKVASLWRSLMKPMDRLFGPPTDEPEFSEMASPLPPDPGHREATGSRFSSASSAPAP